MIPIESANAHFQGSAVRHDLSYYMRPGSLQLATLPPLSLYVHLPWCLKKCPYCDFNSHEMPAAELPEQLYLSALMADIESALPLVWGRTVQSVFLGGGTPSLFSPQAVEQLISGIRARMMLAADCEISLEANPGTFEKDRFKAFRAAGVTRLSIGVQSFNDTFLQTLGRVHNSTQALSAIQEAARTFATFNLDLMYALPGQSLDDLRQDVRTALAFDPSHVSIYHLTIEPNTVFAKYPPEPVDDDLTADMLDFLTETMGQAGLLRYEVSAFAKAGHSCRHNLNYWKFGDYLGIGAGAHSKLSFAHRVVRHVRFRDPRRYIKQALAGIAVAHDEEISRFALGFEFMLNALRLKDGFSASLFTERTGLPISAIEMGLSQAQHRGLLVQDWKTIRPTERGFDFLSDLQAHFLPADVSS